MGAGGKQTTAVAWGVVALAILAAAPIMAASFRAQNDGGFAVSAWALLLGAVWLAAGLIILSQRRPLPVARRSTTSSRLAILLIAAIGLAVASLVGGLILAWWPAMAHFVAEPLRVATSQHLAVLLVVAFATGAAEEVFFRLALPTLLHGWWRWVVPTLVYALVTLASGSLALAVMAAILGVVAMWALEETGWWFAPLVVHAAWTVAMIGIFPTLAPH